jgi:hypothetical protein
VSKNLLRRCLVIGAIMAGIAAVPALLILCYVGYYLWVPRYSAVAYFEDHGFNLRLDFYVTDVGARASGRYLSVIAGTGNHTFNIPDWDWSHKARTSVYRIDDNHIAVLSAMGNDYKVTLKPFEFAPVVSDSGEGWQYLGAFDFAFAPGRRPHLEFFDPQLAECIPMGTDQPGRWADEARPQARHAACPTVRQQP